MFALVAMAATACVADPTMEESAATSTEVAAAKKIVNTSDGALSGEIILYVDEQTAEAWWNGAASAPKPMDQPPRNRVTTTAEPMTMAAYSPMKNEANFIEEYSAW